MIYMRREISLCLAFRDMWQSSCGFFPSVSQLREIASAIVKIGCFDRVETNGGAFEQLCLLNGENPNTAVKEFVYPFKEAGIKPMMLERGLNALRLNPVSSDIRALMFKVKKAQGVEIARSFCGLNDHRNLRYSVESAKSAGMISQVALPIVNSPVHTLEHYLAVVDKVVEYGCDEICLKDMSGQGVSSFMVDLICLIKQRYPSLFIQYHRHCGPDSRDALLAVVRAGADAVDVALRPLSGGASHPDLLEVVDWLRADGFFVKDVDVSAYEYAVSQFEAYLSDVHSEHCLVDSSFSSLLMECGLPGGMMASLVDDISAYHNVVNAALSFRELPGLTYGQFLSRFVEEVKSIWPLLGYPPMVTPYSQYIASAALSNLLAISQEQPRWSSLNSDIWNMILGRMGMLPGPVCSELIELAKIKGLEFYNGEPHELYPDSLECYRSMMEWEGWPVGSNDEELLMFSMFEGLYRSYIATSAGLGLAKKPELESELEDDAVYAAIAMALYEYQWLAEL